MKTTHQGFSVSFVTGSPGAGKSYVLMRDVISRLLASQVTVFTNLPLEVDRIAEYCEKKTGRPAFEFAERIVLLTKEELGRWEDGTAGPWELAERGHADGNDFILDECHRFCQASGATERNKRWTKWLGEVRHEGWRRLVFISQDESKVGKPITVHAELRFELTNAERRRDPILRIPLHYWYELVASITREYLPSVVIVEFRRVNGKMRQQHAESMRLDPAWFPFYRSYEAAGGGTGRGQGGSAIVREFQKRPALLPTRRDGRLVGPVWAWFLAVHWWRFALAVTVAGVACWVTLGGGMNVLLTAWMERMKSVATVNSGTHGVGDGGTASSGSQPVQPTDGVSERTRPAAEITRRGTAVEVAAALQRMDEADRSLVVAELQSFAESYEAAVRKATKVEAERQKERKAVQVVAVTETAAWFSNPPCSCQVGEILDEGPYRGKRLEKINVDRGWAELDGGIRLWVGRGAVPGLSDAEPGPGGGSRSPRPRLAPAVPEPVPALDATGASENGGGSPEAANNDQRRRDGLWSLLQGSGAPSGNVDRGGRRTGKQASDDGSSESTN